MARRPRRRIQLDEPTIPSLAAHIVLDESGSMSVVRDDTIGGINSYIETLRNDSPDALISLTVFSDNNRVRTIWDNVPISEVPALDHGLYAPSGWTALFDGITTGIASLDTVIAQNKALIIMTDGGENNSRHGTLDSVRTSILDRQENQNWLVSFLAANMDAFSVGSTLGVNQGSTMNVSQTARGMSGSFASAAAATSRFRSTGNLQASSYTVDERAAAADEDDNA